MSHLEQGKRYNITVNIETNVLQDCDIDELLQPKLDDHLYDDAEIEIIVQELPADMDTTLLTLLQNAVTAIKAGDCKNTSDEEIANYIGCSVDRLKQLDVL